MKPRLPTPEEKRLWRESNRFTDRSMPEVAEELGQDAASAPFPLGGGANDSSDRCTGLGHEDTPSLATPPLPNSPRRGEEKAPLRPLSQREAKKALKPYGPIQATLDLHGLTKLEAHARVTTFLQHQSTGGRRHVLIITGKGRSSEGILRTNLPHWLNEPALRPMISAFAPGSPEKGGAGVWHVLLKRR